MGKILYRGECDRDANDNEMHVGELFLQLVVFAVARFCNFGKRGISCDERGGQDNNCGVNCVELCVTYDVLCQM